MEEMKGVVLYGSWASPFCFEVEIALKLKGISYTHKEENPDVPKKEENPDQDKSEFLKYNPAYQQIPLLVHNGKPVVTPLLILEYIDETWEKEPRFLPKDPYERARARFWSTYFNNIIPVCKSIVVKEGIELEKAIKDTKEQLRIFEEGVGKDFSAGKTRFFHGNEPGMLDIVVGSFSFWSKVLVELTGAKFFDKETTPILCKQIEAFEELQVVKEAQPRHDKLFEYARNRRNRVLGSKRN